jgi:hypothetical protein
MLERNALRCVWPSGQANIFIDDSACGGRISSSETERLGTALGGGVSARELTRSEVPVPLSKTSSSPFRELAANRVSATVPHRQRCWQSPIPTGNHACLFQSAIDNRKSAISPPTPLVPKAKRSFRIRRLSKRQRMPKPISCSESASCKICTKPRQSQQMMCNQRRLRM